MLSYSGTLALSFPSVPQSASCRLSKVKQAPTATWLQSSTLATLTFFVQQQNGNISLQVHLKGSQVLHIANAVAYSLLPPEETGRGWIFAASCPDRKKACTQMRSFAFQFLPPEGGQHCHRALQVHSLYIMRPPSAT
ncbi:hypothetical protein WJX75_004901 [Coccomyxa subellipsoidea]|uniref:Uncharacterized protein n=1 Tax=Coccomyxa subellipsoidea TaxID=248742 RepID=A0ABR2YTZ7_9CHLO